ncbi:MAG: citrate lyase subunit alpha [Candidatus Heimdallarchaeota archaeon]|nr:MAG: citrate lyase subunit alpha [Candidatus Heimdallarchaeota archaeon]
MGINAVKRDVPKTLFGRTYKPYSGAFSTEPTGVKSGRKFAPRVIKPTTKRIFDDLEQVISKTNLRDGMTLSFIHNLRYGDYVINEVMNTVASMGFKDLTLASSALFPNHKPLIEHIHSGVIGSISGSMNGPIGKAVSTGETPSIPTSLRSHGGRARAVETGDLHLDIAFIAAPAVDEQGNMNGCQGPSAYGACGFANDTDSVFADTVILVTDNLLTDEPVYPVVIRGSNVDYIVTIDKIGDPNKIVAGSLGKQFTKQHLDIAEQVVQVTEATGYLKDGLSFQAGAGGVSLATTQFINEVMTEKELLGSFVHGGTTEAAVKLLEDGLFKCIYDGQSFDLVAVRSLRENPRHIESSADASYNIWKPGGPLANYVDVVALGATEIDIDFNVNVNTHSDGLLLHGIGGHTDAAAAKMTIITCPIARKVPIVREKVTTVSTPGEMIDVVITDAGIAVNPRRNDLQKRFLEVGIDVKDIAELRDMAYSHAAPLEPDFSDEICTAVEFRDGTLLDVIYKVNV